MRRALTGLIIALLIAIAVVAIASLVLTRRALAAAKEVPPVLCLEADTVVQMRSGALRLAQKDRIVAASANFAIETRRGPSLRWHISEAIIQRTYRAFWSQAARAAVFDKVASRMRACPPRDRP